MKKRFIIANWKSHMIESEAKDWIQRITNSIRQAQGKQELQITDATVILCPSFTVLPALKASIAQYGLPVQLGAQDISPFDEGAYTGAVNGKQLKEFVSYVIIGHSERRSLFGETDEVLAKKVSLAKQYGLEPIFCMQGKETVIPNGVSIVAYEPVAAIGTGDPDSPEHANTIAQTVKTKYPSVYVLYGGSVTPENAQAFLNMSDIDGVLVGGASLDPKQFTAIISYAQKEN